jgi:predicted permease
MLQRLLLELGPCLLGGLWLGQRWPALPERLAGPLLGWGMPLSLVALLLRAGLRPAEGTAALLTLVLCGGGLLLSCRWPWLRRQLQHPSLQLGAVVGNTAYFGLPVAMALLPPAAMGTAVAYDLAATLLVWGLGPALLTGERLRCRPLARALAHSPASRALGLALLAGLTPWSHQLGELLWMPARLVLLLALTIVGIHLGQLLRQPRSSRTSPWHLLPALTIKLLLFPAAMLALSLLTPLPALARQAVVLQAAAPTAMSVVLLAEHGNGRETIPAARLVLWSTLLALVSVPLWWALLQATVAM